MLKETTLICTLLAPLVFAPLALADQVVLTNGDKITGAIIKKDGATLTVKSDILGEVSMPWTAVSSISSDNPLNVILPSGQQLQGKLSTSGTEVQIQEPAQTVNAPLTGITTVRNAAEQAHYERLLHPSWLDLWSGDLKLALALARGNADTTTLATGFDATRQTNNDKTTLFFSQLYSTARLNGINSSTADAARGGIGYQHNIGPRWFVTVANTDEFDRFADLNFRFTVGPGIGYHAIKSDRTTLDLLFGGDYLHEDYTTFSRNLAELNGGDTFEYKLSGATTINQDLIVFGAPSDGSYRINFDAGLSTKIKKWFSWTVTASDRYVSNPPIGKKKNDILLTTGLTATFAQ